MNTRRHILNTAETGIFCRGGSLAGQAAVPGQGTRLSQPLGSGEHRHDLQ